MSLLVEGEGEGKGNWERRLLGYDSPPPLSFSGMLGGVGERAGYFSEGWGVEWGDDGK